MSEPFLILHKVRGEPAFDVATRIPCPICHQGEDPMCIECNEEGFWWIIPTSGHRAHPFRSFAMAEMFTHIEVSDGRLDELSMLDEYHRTDFDKMKEWPDHYPCNPSPSKPSFSISSLINNLVPKLRR